jgi:hypothetical protein
MKKIPNLDETITIDWEKTFATDEKAVREIEIQDTIKEIEIELSKICREGLKSDRGR